MSNYREIYEDIGRINTKALNAKVSTEKSSCPDCKDGFYYPFVGPPEPCQTCQTNHCATCEGTNYHLGHPQGTPGPCPDCNEPPADIAFYEGDSSKDASFNRQCKFNDEAQQLNTDFKNHFLVQLKEIASTRFKLKEIPYGQKWVTECHVKDSQLLYLDAKGFATHFYKHTKSAVLEIVEGKELIYLDFVESSVKIVYDHQ